jgi:hypothetical protein
MATIGVGLGSYIRPLRKARVEWFPVDVSQTLKIGYPVILSTDSDEGNRLKVAGADPTTDRAFVGFAAADITTTATHNAVTDRIPVWVADQDTEFLVHVQDAETLDNDDISVEFGIVADSTNLIYRLDTTETSAKVFRVLRLYDAHGDTNGRVVAMCIAPERLYGD